MKLSSSKIFINDFYDDVENFLGLAFPAAAITTAEETATAEAARY